MASESAVQFVELFCGIGGFAEAVGDTCEIHAAIDINQNAIDVYQMNFCHAVFCKTIESLTAAQTAQWTGKSWWMSPPCQPFTRRGHQNDLVDSRSKAFLNVLKLIDEHRPPEILLENVPEFSGSNGHALIVGLLEKLNYHVKETMVCPTEFGWANRRRRFYLVAAQTEIGEWKPKTHIVKPQYSSQNETSARELFVDNDLREKYLGAMHVVSDESNSETACFTSAYGRSHIRSGSYLSSNDGLRRFSPREILSQLGFGKNYQLPAWPAQKLWPLVGNSVSILATRYVVSHLPSICKLDVTTAKSW